MLAPGGKKNFFSRRRGMTMDVGRFPSMRGFEDCRIELEHHVRRL